MQSILRYQVSFCGLVQVFGANVEEALAGQSRKDFFAKMSIASKEARETNYWLRLIKDAGIFDGQESQNLVEASEELIKILTSIVKTGNDNRQDGLKKTKNSKLRTQNYSLLARHQNTGGAEGIPALRPQR